MGTWYLIETLVEGEATLVASGDEVKDLLSIRRNVSPAADILVEPIVEHVRQTREPFDRVLRSKRADRSWRFYAWPIIGPFGDVYGIQMWIGNPKEEMTERRLTSGVFWSTTDWLIHQTWESGGDVRDAPGGMEPDRVVLGLHQPGDPLREGTGVPGDHPEPETWDGAQYVVLGQA